ncbi:hypothetical protein PQX77_003449 [Marasmius sp. AFHP31]|nr:hypothetical protein PQX77_003449 [Marasmius sp. AFHP31]
MKPPKPAIERVSRTTTHRHFYDHQSKKMEYATRNPRRGNLNAADEVPTTGKGAGELWTFLELGDESEAKHDTKSEAEDEDEWDPNDLVHKAAHKQQFSRLFNNPHAGLNASEWKERNKNKVTPIR